MTLKVTTFWRLFVLSFMAVPVTHICDKLLRVLKRYNVHGASIAIIGIILLGSVAFATVVIIRRSVPASKKKSAPVDPCLYVFSVFAFTACLDMGIALEIDGFISSFVTQYLIDGEPYLNCAFGALICYFDGTVMYSLYLIMIYAITNNKSYRSVALYWVGTIVNSMLTALFGIFAGKLGLYPSTILNLPYFIIPIIIGWNVWHQRPVKALPKSVSPISKRLDDVGFIVFLVFAIGIAVLRAFAALGTTLWLPNYYVQTVEPYLHSSDPAPFPKAQMLVYLFYYVPIYLLITYGLVNPGISPWFYDVSLIHAGAAAQAQVSHIGSSIHFRTPAQFHPSTSVTSQFYFWTINLLLAIVPQLLLMRNYFRGKPSRSVSKPAVVKNSTINKQKKTENGTQSRRKTSAKVIKSKPNKEA